jgi:peptide/nickel transport system substrate-binding protein
VRDDAPWLGELAKAIAATISRPSHEVTAKPIPASELASRRAARNYTLALDVVRPVAPGSFGAMVALATADNAGRASELMQHPPKLGEIPARTMTRTMRCGVVGEIRVQGGRAPDVQLAASSAGSGFDLGASTRTRAR